MRVVLDWLTLGTLWWSLERCLHLSSYLLSSNQVIIEAPPISLPPHPTLVYIGHYQRLIWAEPRMAFKCSSAHLPLRALGAWEYQLIDASIALCLESVADSIVGGERAGGTFKGLLASFTVQHPTSVDPADRGQPVVMGVLGMCSGACATGDGARTFPSSRMTVSV